jgi:hypothetical protein
VALAVGRMVRLRVGQEVVETLDTVRFDHLMAFARGTRKPWPALEQLRAHQHADIEVDPDALIDELQRLAAQERPPEEVAPLIGLLRNDAARVKMLAQAKHAGR